MGFAVIRPLRVLSPHAVLAAPFVGLLILSFMSLGVYVVLKQSFEHAAILACIITWAPSLWLLWRRPEGMLKRQHVLILASISSVTTVTCCGATIQTATSAIGFFRRLRPCGLRANGGLAAEVQCSELPQGLC